jgi:hypothetical protein
MAIRFDLITEINDTDFNRMFDDCIDNLNNGSYPWEGTPVAAGDNEAKREYIRTQFQSHLNSADAGGVVFVCSEDGYALTMSSGFVEGTHFVGTMILIGRNQAGSKSYMYADEYHAAREAFWDEVNYLTWDFQTLGPGTAFFDHIATVYNDTVTNNPDWIQNARMARARDGDMAGEIVPGEANTTIVPAHAIQENELGNSGLRLTTSTPIPGEEGVDGEFEPEDDPERLQWLEGTHPDQQPPEEE